MSEQPPPTKEELMGKLEDLRRGFADMRDRAAKHAAPRPGSRWRIICLLVGLPIASAIGVWIVWESILFSLLAAVGALVVVVLVLTRGPLPPSLQPGTRSWEARLTVDVLDRVISRLTSERVATLDPAEQARRDREIAFLREQRHEYQIVWGSEDPSPGKGCIEYTPYEEP